MAQFVPQWKILVDWNNDGDFADANEDVTGDVEILTFDHLRDIQTDYIEAAKLGFVLKNNTHTYTPTNSASGLYGNLKPGRRVWALCAYPWDGFTGANATSLSARALARDANYSWTVASGGWTIQSNQAQGDNNATDILWTDFGSADCYVGCDYTRQTALGGLLLRYVDTSNYIYLRVEAAQLDLRQVNAGVDSSIATGAHTWTAGDQKFLHVWLHGDSIRVFVGRTEIIDASSSFNNTATKFGLYGGYSGGTATRDSMDNWGGWRSLVYGILDKITPRPEQNHAYADITALDDFERFRKAEMFTISHSTVPYRSDQIAGDLLNFGGFASADRQMGTGVTLVNDTSGIKSVSGPLLDNLYGLQDEEVGFVQMDGLGFLSFLARNERTSAPWSNVLGTLVGTSAGSLPYYRTMAYEDGVGNVENRVLVSVQRSSLLAPAVVWTLQEVTSFTATAVKVFMGQVKTYDLAIGYVVPTATVDYAAHADSAGTGSLITDQIAVAYTGSMLGKYRSIQVTWGTTPGYLTKLVFRAASPYNYLEPFWVQAYDATSDTTHGERKRVITTKFLDQAVVAGTMADTRLTRRKNPSTILKVEVANVSKANAFLMVHRTLNMKVLVVNSAMGINANYYIEGYQWDVSKGGTEMKINYLLRAA